MKKIFAILLLFLIGVFIPFGCTSDNSNTGTSSLNPQIINVYNWSTYIDPEVLRQFEKQFGVKIRYDTYESSEDLYAKLKAGNPGYDLIFPSDVYVTIMAKEGLLEELNLNNIPNTKYVDNKFLNATFDPQNKYSLPYQWGTMGFGYNIKKTGGEIDSWKQIFEPKYQGQVALVDELRSMLGGILIYLGYSPNTTNPEEINKAKDFLIKHKANIAAFAPDNGQMLLNQGEVEIAVEWSGDIFQIMEENLDIRYVIPKEGSIIWIDNMSIPKNAPHKELAEKFINFMNEPEIAAKNSNYIRYATPNKTALEMGLIDKKDRENPAIYPPSKLFEKLTYITDVGSATKLYDEAWTDIKAAINN